MKVHCDNFATFVPTSKSVKQAIQRVTLITRTKVKRFVKRLPMWNLSWNNITRVSTGICEVMVNVWCTDTFRLCTFGLCTSVMYLCCIEKPSVTLKLRVMVAINVIANGIIFHHNLISSSIASNYISLNTLKRVRWLIDRNDRLGWSFNDNKR